MAFTANQPEAFYFKDDGKIPNNRLPLLLYRSALSNGASARDLQKQFATNNWTNSWDNGVYPFHHYHSTSHEVLGIYSGSALLHLGGEKGEKLTVKAGDVIVIPAGVGHKNLGASNDFGVVGAYPEGRSWDLLKGEPGERPKADKNIAALPIPDFDPILGKTEGLRKLWN
ncbi:MAG TPA: cupin domain-containing protein [Chryseolinea sp.]|nr:cupin domain-containing protein [Chryseolinea sp.]